MVVGEFQAERQVPEGGLPTWAEPDPTKPSDNQLEASVPVMVIEETTGWAHVRCENGWEAWVDATKLVDYVPPPFAATHVVGSSGLETRESPDVAKPVTNRLDPGLGVIVVNTWGDWAKVRCDNDWEAWVDGRGLMTASAPAASAATPGVPAASTSRASASPLAMWLPIVGAAVAIIGGFLPWYSFGGESISAWDIRFLTLITHEPTDVAIDAGVVLLVLVLAAIPLVTQRPLARGLALALGIVGAGIALLAIVLLLDTPDPRPSIGIGLVLTLLGGLVLGGGALMAPRR